MVLVEVHLGELSIQAAVELSRERHRMCGAMSAYIGWLAPQMDQLKTDVPVLRDKYTEELRLGWKGHNRVPRNYGGFMVGIHLFSRFAVEKGFFTEELARALIERSMAAFKLLMQEQQIHVEDEHPGRRFLSLLDSVISSGEAVVYPLGAGAGDSWGKPCIGWTDATDNTLYLDPHAAYKAVDQMAAPQGGIGVPQTTLWKQLHQLGALASTEPSRETLKVRKTIGGKRRSLIHLRFDLCSDQPALPTLGNLGLLS